ncbi:AMP-binding protein [Pseudanabaena sp. FACHB-2040]|uniref:AMP-dependent synthetase/ligase n=1 Tax=Pseudanabaena sp. FACHB-2040 TaxID=2692859 RepID=UPI0016883C3A|nr:AMP-binding protein [Pseudanabaena sp. FACHB-2040]MBD2258453.1 AMP-binding protein [Pseudanabaena sp. FACHB-2040]
MNAISVSHCAALEAESPILGRTLPALLDQACEGQPSLQEDPAAPQQTLNQWRRGRWQSLPIPEFRRAAEEFALGLETLGLVRGDRVALVMHSDTGFAIADMGCLLAGLVDVPIDLTQTIENILFILQQTAAKALVISNQDLLNQLMPYLWETPELGSVVLVEIEETREYGDAPPRLHIPASSSPHPESCLQIPRLLCQQPSGSPCPSPCPQCVQLATLAEVSAWGWERWSEAGVRGLRDAIAPHDLATILYIPSETKQPRGVMLSHENITANVLAAFSSYPDLPTGPEEVALLFLPLTHIFARVFLYGHLAFGHSIYFSDANHLIKHLRRVKPTFLITVPRLLEKVHERILDRAQHLSRFDRAVLLWAIKLAQRFNLNRTPHRLYALQLQLADRLVFGQWRDVFGGRLRACISGGAALSEELVRFFSAAGVPVLQGYGLTESSGVVCYNRGTDNRAGTVGMPIPGVEVAIAPDHEILIRAPFVMQGYYQDPEATRQAIDEAGWLHTGDLGTLSADRFLTITGVKKPLFKLSTGKYVSALPLEQGLMRSPLVAHAITVGLNRKFCGLLIFPNLEALRVGAETWGIDAGCPGWLQQPRIVALYQPLIDTANCHLPYWSTVRKFVLVDAELTQENGLLLADGRVNRTAVLERFAGEIEGLYGGGEDVGRGERGDAEREGRGVWGDGEGGEACPVYAKSLMRH